MREGSDERKEANYSGWDEIWWENKARQILVICCSHERIMWIWLWGEKTNKSWYDWHWGYVGPVAWLLCVHAFYSAVLRMKAGRFIVTQGSVFIALGRQTDLLQCKMHLSFSKTHLCCTFTIPACLNSKTMVACIMWRCGARAGATEKCSSHFSLQRCSDVHTSRGHFPTVTWECVRMETPFKVWACFRVAEQNVC